MGINSRGSYISPHKLIRIWKKIKEEDLLKVWVKKDFGDRRGIALNVLKKMGLIEEVPVIYYCGKKKTTRRYVIGYKLIVKGDKNEKAV